MRKKERGMQQNFLNTKCFLSHEFFIANVRERGDDKINRLEIAPFGWLSSAHVIQSELSHWPKAKSRGRICAPSLAGS